jgi:hypothetical protein
MCANIQKINAKKIIVPVVATNICSVFLLTRFIERAESILTFECEMNKVSPVFNMSLDRIIPPSVHTT